MNILIVEDEPLAAEKLGKMLKRIEPSLVVSGICDSVSSAVEWINKRTTPDLGLFDIQLGDGTSFEIFERTLVTFPVIFATAYDQFAIRAFKVNSVDYLLKPVEEDDLRNALSKFRAYYQQPFTAENFTMLIRSTAKMVAEGQKYKDRFVVNVGEHIRIIKTQNTACFYSEDKATYLLDSEGKVYYMDQSLNQIEVELNPAFFFRTSRKEIVNIDAISDIVSYGRARLKVKVDTGRETRELIVSRDRMKLFKNWLGQRR